MKHADTAAGPVAECLPALNRYARKLCRNHPEDAEDLVQATVERALRLDWQGDVVHQPEAYLIRILRNIFLDRLRRSGRDEGASDAVLEAIPVPGNQDMALICTDTLKAIAEMPAPMRRLMHMAAEGESYRDIANALGVPVGTVTSRLARARADLAEQVGWSRGRAA